MGRLVDYASDDSDASAGHASPVTNAPAARPAKKRKTAQGAARPEATAALPPLPSSFHDLYASTVRVSTVDDPSLHQGRKRQIPHVAGNWPTHLYIEWHPTSAEHEVLTDLMAKLSSCIASRPSLTSLQMSDFVTSDLGAPLPLHISLSRPLALTTAIKDDFLEQLRHKLRSCPVSPFPLRPCRLEWHRTAESARSFLVLRVARAGPNSSAAAAASGARPPKPEAEGEAAGTPNAELTELLTRCNDLAKVFQQPALYAFAATADSGQGSAPGEDSEPKAQPGTRAPLGDAFHISVAWTFAQPTPELLKATREAFASGPEPLCERIGAIRIPVDGVKAKIGNAVTHVPLPERGRAQRILEE